MRDRTMLTVLAQLILAIAALMPAGVSAQAVDADKEPAEQSALSPNVVPLDTKQQKKLLKRRLAGGMHLKFRQFANMFIVKSQQEGLGYTVALATKSDEIADTELQTSFPTFYKPTLREFLDAMALQTFSHWKYDPSDEFVERGEGITAPVTNLAVFEFTEHKNRPKPYRITPAENWKRVDRGNWTKYIPPTFPVGMDIYEMGTYSDADKEAEPELFKRIEREVSLEWANRVSKGVKLEALGTAKVGSYDATFFDTTLPSEVGKSIHWRQWVFMVGNRCFFIVSTILPELEDSIYPDVQAMLKSFEVVEKDGPRS